MIGNTLHQQIQKDMAAFTYENGNYQFDLKIVAEAVRTEHVGANAIEAFDTVMATSNNFLSLKWRDRKQSKGISLLCLLIGYDRKEEKEEL